MSLYAEQLSSDVQALFQTRLGLTLTSMKAREWLFDVQACVVRRWKWVAGKQACVVVAGNGSQVLGIMHTLWVHVLRKFGRLHCSISLLRNLIEA